MTSAYFTETNERSPAAPCLDERTRRFSREPLYLRQERIDA